MSDPAYSVRERRMVYGTDLFSVFADTLVDEHEDVIAPNYLVVAPKERTKEGVTGVVVVPYLEGKIGLVRVFRHAVSRSGWEVPRGFIEEGETLVLAALRELEEETGLACKPESMIDMGSVAPDPGILDARLQCFLAKGCVFSGKALENEFGHHGFHMFTASEIEQLILDGYVQDSVSLAVYFMAQSNMYST